MNTTINETKAINCPRCAGKGRISAFSYNKGGECFGCNGTGSIHKMISRPMTDAEVITSLASLGFSIMPQETTVAPTGNWFLDMVQTEDDAATMIGARRLLELA